MGKNAKMRVNYCVKQTKIKEYSGKPLYTGAEIGIIKIKIIKLIN